MNPKDPGAIAYLHPAIATVTLFLCFWMLRMGLAQRKQRTRATAAPAGTLKRHSTLGPWVVALYVFTAAVGLASAVGIRGMKPLASWHGRVALVGGAGFAVVWLLGRTLLAGEKQRANLHGVLGVVAFFVAGIAGLLGISMLP